MKIKDSEYLLSAIERLRDIRSRHAEPGRRRTAKSIVAEISAVLDDPEMKRVIGAYRRLPESNSR